ncbi:MAG: hypothetical protein ACLSA6_18715 [Holdemania massiliensis]
MGTGAVQAVVDFIPQWIYNGLKSASIAGVRLRDAAEHDLTREIGAFYFIGFVLSAFWA